MMPAYNEEATLQQSVQRVLDSPWTAEIVIVDDGSAVRGTATRGRVRAPHVSDFRYRQGQD